MAATVAEKQHPKPVTGRFYRIVPDFVVEILSPSTSRRDRNEKRRIYEKNGISEYWIVDPPRRRVDALRLDAGKYSTPVVFVRGTIESSALPGLRIPLDTIFADCE